jgi:excisionase family DNA binding protein
MSDYLKPEDVARKLGVTRPTVLALARAGKIPYIELGKRIFRFDAADVETAIQSLKKTRKDPG